MGSTNGSNHGIGRTLGMVRNRKKRSRLVWDSIAQLCWLVHHLLCFTFECSDSFFYSSSTSSGWQTFSLIVSHSTCCGFLWYGSIFSSHCSHSQSSLVFLLSLFHDSSIFVFHLFILFLFSKTNSIENKLIQTYKTKQNLANKNYKKLKK